MNHIVNDERQALHYLYQFLKTLYTIVTIMHQLEIMNFCIRKIYEDSCFCVKKIYLDSRFCVRKITQTATCVRKIYLDSRAVQIVNQYHQTIVLVEFVCTWRRSLRRNDVQLGYFCPRNLRKSYYVNHKNE